MKKRLKPISRRHFLTGTAAADPEFEKAQENLEAIALKLESLLRRAEQSV